MKTKIAIFASGRGTNASALISYFKGHPSIKVDCVFCNRKEAGVMQLAEQEGCPAYYFSERQFKEATEVLDKLKERNVDWIVLAGFLLMVPKVIVGAFSGRMVNIHPALLPKFGGKGMYGDRVHQAVLEANESKSGISIHWVDQHYDSGSIIQQFECKIAPSDGLAQLRAKVQKLEHQHLPPVMEALILNEKA